MRFPYSTFFEAKIPPEHSITYNTFVILTNILIYIAILPQDMRDQIVTGERDLLAWLVAKLSSNGKIALLLKGS